MFKLVVLFSAVCALAAGKPGALFAAPLAAPLATSFASPLTYSPTFYSPSATLAKTSAVLHSAPIYQTPTFISGAHFIKKRSAITPFATSFAAPLAYTSTIFSPAHTITQQASSVLHPSPLYHTPTLISGAHFIKKRSAVAPFATTFAAPLAYTSTIYSPATTITKQTSSVLHPSPLYQAPTFISGAHFIKKRSALAPFLTSPAIIAPAAFASHIAVPTKTIYSAGAPIIAHGAFSAPLAYAHI